MVLLLSIAITHAFGALATNYSMALIPAASTHVLKVLEPMITGGIAWLTIGVQENASVTRVLAVVLVVIGAVGATNYNPSGHHSFYQIGLHVLPALLSNVLYGSRNVLIKHLGHRFLFDAVTMGKVSLFGALMLLIPFTSLVMCVGNWEFLPILFTRSSALLLIGSALCHATYSYISTSVILSQISVISHAIANVSKRIVVIVLLYIFGQKGYLSPYFLILFCIGLAMYTKDSLGENDKKEPARVTILYKHYVVVAILTIASVTLLLTYMSEPGITHLLSQRQSFFKFNNVVSRKLAFMQASTSEKVKLAGIDRTNNTDSTMKFMLTASDAVREARSIHMEIYRDLIGHYRKAALFGLADHDNYGDSAITVGEHMLLNKLGIEIVYYCNNYACDLSAAKHAIESTTEPVLIIASGGGNFCNWKTECNQRALVTKTFKGKEIIVFPQSVNFKSRRDMEEHAKAMNVNSNITYLFRDHVSYNTIVNSGLFKYKRAILCPDIAVQIGIQSFSFTPSHDIYD